jgi:hypothetical protein
VHFLEVEKGVTTLVSKAQHLNTKGEKMDAPDIPRLIGSPESILQHPMNLTNRHIARTTIPTADQTPEQMPRASPSQPILHVITPALPAEWDVWQRRKSHLVSRHARQLQRAQQLKERTTKASLGKSSKSTVRRLDLDDCPH